MDHFRFLLMTGLLSLLNSPALAQQAQGTPNPPPVRPPFFMYGPGFGHYWMGGGGSIIGAFVLLLALIGFVTVIALLVRVFTFRAHYRWHRYPGIYRDERSSGRALGILEERLARGEIDKAEFEEKRNLLSR